MTTRYNVQRCSTRPSRAATPSTKGHIETQTGLNEFALREWIFDTLDNPLFQWFYVGEAKFDYELSTPKAHRSDTR